MLKLNNNGWSLATLIIFVCVFALFLIVVAFLTWNVNKSGITTNDVLEENILFK